MSSDPAPPLRPGSSPWQQLLALWWAAATGNPRPSGPTYSSTHRLLHLGYVRPNPSTTTVTLTPEGAAAAHALSSTPHAAAYLRRLTLEEFTP